MVNKFTAQAHSDFFSHRCAPRLETNVAVDQAVDYEAAVADGAQWITTAPVLAEQVENLPAPALAPVLPATPPESLDQPTPQVGVDIVLSSAVASTCAILRGVPKRVLLQLALPLELS